MTRRILVEVDERDLARVLELALERLDRYAGEHLAQLLAGKPAPAHLAAPDVDAFRRVRDEYLDQALKF